MTTTYQAKDHNCEECGVELEEYTGHLEASEVSLCEECYEETHDDKWKHRVQVVHKVPPK